MLVTLLEIKEFLKIKLDNDAEDDRLSSINTYVASLIESYCGRNISSSTYTEYYNGGVASVFIKNPPITSVHEVTQFNGSSYTSLGGPGSMGQQVVVPGTSHTVSVLGGAKTTTRVKKYGESSLVLNGTDAYLAIPSSDDFNFDGEPFTIEGYFRSKDLQDASLVSRSEDSANYWELGYSNTSGLFFKSVEGGVESNYVGGSTVTANTFTHVAVVRSEDSFKLFKNGVQTGTTIASSNAMPTLSSSLEIGRINQAPNNYFNGHIDELRVSWIDRYSSTFSSTLSSLSSDEDTKLLLHFNEGQDKTTMQDFSRKVNQFIWYADTGEVTFDTGNGSGTPKLGFFNPRKSLNYTNGIKVNYTGGYLTVPADIKLAALEMIKLLYKGREGAKSVRLQGEDSTSHDLSMDGFPPQVRRVLSLYRLPI
jgi:hypothetical protein